MPRHRRPEVAELALGLSALLEPAHTTAQALSRTLGYHPSYLGRVFRGENAFKVELAFAVLAELGVDPIEFFEELYPFGGEAMKTALREVPAARVKSAFVESLREDSRLLHGEREDSPADWTRKAGAVLASLLKRRGVSQGQASRAAGYGPSVLGQAMRGASQLTFDHVFAALEVGKIPVGRFVKELFGPPDGELLAVVRWRKLLDEAERLVPGYVQRFTERRRGEKPGTASLPPSPPAPARKRAKPSRKRPRPRKHPPR